MTCKECFHFKVCDSGRHIGEYIEDDGIYSEGVEKECITFIPSADIVEVRHGEWKVYFDGKELMCSSCKATFWDEDGNGGTNYCPHCGAKMDGGRREE